MTYTMTCPGFTVTYSTTTDDKTVKADCLYTLDNGYTEKVIVPIFQPPTFSDVVNGVHSRGLTIQSQHG